MQELLRLSETLKYALQSAESEDRKQGEDDLQCAAIEARLAAYRDMARYVSQQISDAL